MDRTMRAALVATVLLAVRAAGVASQAPDRAMNFEDYGLDRPLDASVRGLGLSAFSATVNDASALAYNPAGLARIKRPSGVASLAGARAGFETSFDGAARSFHDDDLTLQFVGAAFPFPTLRGSLVAAVGVQRLYSSALAISYQGFNAPDARNDRLALDQSGAVYAYHVGGAVDLSAAFAVGATLMILDGSIDRVRQYDTRRLVIDPNVHTFVYEDTRADIDGLGARIGLLFYAFERLQLAVSLSTPLVVDVGTTTLTETTRQVDNNVGTFTRESTAQSAEYKTPYAVEAAMAVPATRSLRVTLQTAYADWSQATIDDERLITTRHGSVLRAVVDVRAGAEWTPARWPLRLHAGIARARRAAGFLQADRIDEDRLERVESESEIVRYSLGAGYLVRGSIGIDAAVAIASGERAAATVADARDGTWITLGCAYWF